MRALTWNETLEKQILSKPTSPLREILQESKREWRKNRDQNQTKKFIFLKKSKKQRNRKSKKQRNRKSKKIKKKSKKE